MIFEVFLLKANWSITAGYCPVCFRNPCQNFVSLQSAGKEIFGIKFLNFSFKSSNFIAGSLYVMNSDTMMSTEVCTCECSKFWLRLWHLSGDFQQKVWPGLSFDLHFMNVVQCPIEKKIGNEKLWRYHHLHNFFLKGTSTHATYLFTLNCMKYSLKQNFCREHGNLPVIPSLDI